MKRILSLLLAALCLPLAGCSLLEGDFSQVEPHADRYWESAADDILRATSYQDLVNTILLLIEGQESSGVIRLYLSDVTYGTAWEMVQRACREVREETAIGSYSLQSLNFSVEELRDSYYQVSLLPVYRRTQEDIDSIVETSSSSAIYDMVLLAWQRGESRLTVRYTYLSEDEATLAENILLLQQELEGTPPENTAEEGAESEAPEGEDPEGEENPQPDLTPWEIHFYPPGGDSSIVEIFFHPQEGQAEPPTAAAPEEGADDGGSPDADAGLQPAV